MNETQLDSHSLDIVSENIQKLKQLFPDVFSENSIDFEKLKAVLGEYTDDESERYNFTWWGKQRALRLAQTSSTGTLRPCKEESKDWDTTGNLYIEGDNLEVLKLMQKAYHGKIKMIYIDPPYNTGNDFVYPDDYKDNLRNYLEMTRQVDGEGRKVGTNSEASGRYHTNWLNMMYPRLRLARNLLSEHGTIFITIDDCEVANLRRICDEIFGEENFVTSVAWQKKVSPSNDATWFSSDHDHILIYAKSKTSWRPNRLPMNDRQKGYYTNPDRDHRGPWNSATYTCNKNKDERPNLYYPLINPNTGSEVWPKETAVWAYSEKMSQQHAEEDLIYWGKDGKSNSPRLKKFLTEAKGVVPRTVWLYTDVGHTQEATKILMGLINDIKFETPKPIRLIQHMLKIASKDSENDIILDFFAGSCSTAQAVMELNTISGGNRHHIMVQFPEPVMHRNYKSLADVGKERIRRAGEQIKTGLVEKQKEQKSLLEDEQPIGLEALDIGFRVFKLDSSNLKKWNPDHENLETSLFDAIENYVEGRSELDVVFEIMLKYGIDLALPIEENALAGKNVYSVGYGALLICLDNDITIDLAHELIRLKNDLKPEIVRVVFKDNGFKDDSAKTNVREILRTNGIDEIVSV
jgi:adenine-specific DNA-methyltransferase